MGGGGFHRYLYAVQLVICILVNHNFSSVSSVCRQFFLKLLGTVGFFGWLQTHSVVMVTFVDNDEPGRMQEGITFTVGKCNVLTETARRQPL